MSQQPPKQAHSKSQELGKGAWLPFVLIFLFWDIYLFLTLRSPVSASLGLSDSQITLLRLTVALPYLFIWEAAGYAFIRVRNYAKTISGSPEAPAFRQIASGLLVLMVGLIAPTIIGSIRNLFAEGSTARILLTIIVNYGYAWPYLVSFLFFFTGTWALRGLIGRRSLDTRLIIYGVLLLVFSYFWLDLIFSNTARSAPTASQPATYYLKDSLIVLTIVLPAFSSWVLGIAGSTQLRQYYQQVKGTIYRQALASMVRGVWAVIIGSILLQGLFSLGNNRLLALGLGKLLAVIYIFVLLQGIGFASIARAARKLTEIETV